MGFLRLILASLVLISHLGISIAGVNPGVSAVIVFYMLAGHVVARLWQRRPHAAVGRGALWFWRDRLWRILPMYLFCLSLACVVWLAGAQSPFLARAPQLDDGLANLLIVPLNYYMYTGQDAFTLLPPAWSLAAELQFYLLAPLLFGRPVLAAWAATLSFVVFALAQFGILDTDIFGYRLLPGVGFVFLAGTLLARPEPWARRLLLALWLGGAAYAVALLALKLHRPYDLDVALGLALGLPMLAALLRHPLPAAWQPWQRWAGELSYGLFLLHFPVMWALQLLGTPGPRLVWGVWVCSVLLAALGHALVERPLWRRFRPQVPVA